MQCQARRSLFNLLGLACRNLLLKDSLRFARDSVPGLLDDEGLDLVQAEVRG